MMVIVDISKINGSNSKTEEIYLNRNWYDPGTFKSDDPKTHEN